MSRYYDPEIGRFLNADDVNYLDPETIGGLNLYAYCLNNPIKYSDCSGHFPFLIALILGLGIIVGGALGGKHAYDKAVKAGKTGADLFWSTVGGAILGAGVGLAIGGAVVFTIGITAGIAGGLATSILGVSAHQAFAWGLLAWNFTAWVIMPIYGITLQGIEYDPSPVNVPKPQPNTHPAYKNQMYRWSSYLTNQKNTFIL